jgi:hypothetical protein
MMYIRWWSDQVFIRKRIQSCRWMLNSLLKTAGFPWIEMKKRWKAGTDSFAQSVPAFIRWTTIIIQSINYFFCNLFFF